MPKVWLITGASRGLGRAITNAALAAGDRVVATSRDGVLRDGAKAGHDRLLVLPLDVASPDDQAYASVVEQALRHFGHIDVLVNNAGYGLISFFEETDDAQVRDVFETNVFGLMRVTRAVLPVMRRQHSGHIINLSSMAGYVGGSATYSATKFAVTGFTEALAQEVGQFGIKVTSVGPGYFRTDFLDSSSVQHRPATEIADYAPAREQIEGFLASQNHNQAGDPNALARLIIEVAGAMKPPAHLLVGADAIAAVEQRERSLLADIDAWRERAAATALVSA